MTDHYKDPLWPTFSRGVLWYMVLLWSFITLLQSCHANCHLKRGDAAPPISSLQVVSSSEKEMAQASCVPHSLSVSKHCVNRVNVSSTKSLMTSFTVGLAYCSHVFCVVLGVPVTLWDDCKALPPKWVAPPGSTIPPPHRPRYSCISFFYFQTTNCGHWHDLKSKIYSKFHMEKWSGSLNTYCFPASGFIFSHAATQGTLCSRVAGGSDEVAGRRWGFPALLWILP